MRLPALVFGVLALAGCQAVGGSPHLIELTELTPTRLGAGETIELHGRGFPEGRRARVTFRGELARAGRESERRVEISGFAETLSPHTLSLTLDRRLESEFCGGESPQHSTFHGSVEAAFAPRTAGAPPVTGELAEVVLDVVPQASWSEIETRAREGERFAEFVGVLVNPEARGVAVQGVLPRSRAESAGIAAGDVIAELDGVKVLGPEDFVPTPSLERSRVVVRRANQKNALSLPLDSKGFRPKSPQELVPAAALVLIALTLALVLLTPLGRALTWLERRIVQRARTVSTGLERGREPLRSRAARALSAELPSGPGPYLGIVLTVAAFSAIAMGRTLVAAELDLAVVLMASVTSLAVACLLDAGRPKTTWGERLRLFGGVLLQQAPLVLSLAAAALAASSVRAFDLVAAQGAAPWRYGAFASPMALLAFWTFILALVPGATRQGELAAEGRRRPGTVLACAEWVHLMTACLLGALVFGGGFRLPGVSLATASIVLQGLGAVLLCCKALLLVAVVLGLRALLGRVDAAQSASLTLRFLLPAALVVLALTRAWQGYGAQSALSSAQGALGYASFAGFCALVVLFAARVATELRRGGEGTSVSPWL